MSAGGDSLAEEEPTGIATQNVACKIIRHALLVIEYPQVVWRCRPGQATSETRGTQQRPPSSEVPSWHERSRATLAQGGATVGCSNSAPSQLRDYSISLPYLIFEPSILRMLPASAPDSNVVDPGPRKRRGATALQACDRCRNKVRAGLVLSANHRK